MGEHQSKPPEGDDKNISSDLAADLKAAASESSAVDYFSPEERIAHSLSKAAQKLNFAPEYTDQSGDIPKAEGKEAAKKFSGWVEAYMLDHVAELKNNEIVPDHPTAWVTRGKDFKDGSSLVFTIMTREKPLPTDKQDVLRGSTAAVWARVRQVGLPVRHIMWRVDQASQTLIRDENNNPVYGDITDDELEHQHAQGLNSKICGLEELAGLMYNVDDEELPKTDSFFTHNPDS